MKFARIFFCLIIIPGTINLACGQQYVAEKHYVAENQYMTQKAFLELAFSIETNNTKPVMKTLWLSAAIQQQIRPILGHNYPKLRLRYWQRANQTVWFLDKIGKERPISFAISVNNNQVKLARVLSYRETRGYEITMKAFTEQFKQVRLTENNQLSHHIDGITGATMSVAAMKKVTQMALMLNKIISR